MSLDQKETAKEFSAEDLKLLEGVDVADDDKSVTEQEVTDKSEDKTSEDTKQEKKEEKKKEEKRGDTLFDDLDDDEDSEPEEDKSADGETADDDKSDKKEEKKEDEKKETTGDWRSKFVELALHGQKDKLTAAKLDKRKEALLRDLGRYKSQEDYMLAGLAAREKLRTGEYKRTSLPEDATDEEVQAWRKENGIPIDAKDYEIPKVPGYKWTELDDPYIDSFKSVAFKANMNQAQMNEVANWYAQTMAEQQDKYLEEMASQDRADSENLDDTIRAELGPADYKPSRELVRRFLKDEESGFGKFKDILLGARYTDDEGKSKRLINNTEFTRHLIDLAHETYGDAAMISGDARTSMSDRKREIEKIMSTDMNEYWRKGLDKEYNEIIQREEKSQGRRRTA